MPGPYTTFTYGDPQPMSPYFVPSGVALPAKYGDPSSDGAGGGAGASNPVPFAVDLQGAVLGVPYSLGLSASGGTGPYAYSLASGTLPPGLSLSSGVISGTPTSLGSYTFTIEATDSLGATGTTTFSIEVEPVAGNFVASS